jgi:hypothetical protein
MRCASTHYVLAVIHNQDPLPQSLLSSHFLSPQGSNPSDDSQAASYDAHHESEKTNPWLRSCQPEENSAADQTNRNSFRKPPGGRQQGFSRLSRIQLEGLAFNLQLYLVSELGIYVSQKLVFLHIEA